MRRHSSLLLICALLCFYASNLLSAQAIPARALVTVPVNEARLVTLAGNVRPELKSARDLGPVRDSQQLQHLLLQLKRPVERQQALDDFLTALHDPASPNYHKWMTPLEFQQQFGLAQQDIMAVTDWLKSHSLVVNAIYPNLAIDVSGTAGRIAEAFHTSIHSVQAGGNIHIANVSQPKVPAALAAVIAGPASLSDFRPHSSIAPHPALTMSSTMQPVVPGDLQKIYNFSPLYAAGVSGSGQQIAVIEDSNLYSTGDWDAFRKTLGLAMRYGSGNLVVEHPQGSAGACTDPGDNADDSEATADAEWASAAAPDATVVVASCASIDATPGIFLALQNLITNPNPPQVISLSFVESETELGAAGNSYVNALYELAGARGISIIAAAGDSGAAASDAGATGATHGIGANGLASTPNNVAVGGTDFADTFLGENTTYWSSTNDPMTFASALSYIPEAAWNDSCASDLIATSLGYGASYGLMGFCNSSLAQEFGFVNTAAAGGAPSGCATGYASVSDVVGGTCAGYTKPIYQASLIGNPSDNVRDVPDLSLFASNGVWGHYYVLCYSNPAGGGRPCINNPAAWAGFGGTSVSAPVLAGLQALVNQATGTAQGNPDYVYYRLAGAEYGTSGSAACNSSLGNAVDTACIFYDVTLGDMDVPCQALPNSGPSNTAFNCYYPADDPGVSGVLSTSETAYEPAYASHVGWDFATGIGSVNAYNLVANWPGSSLASTLSAMR